MEEKGTSNELEDLRNRVAKLEERLYQIEKSGKIEMKPNKNIYKPIRFKNAL
jgi:hypothetical protein